MASGVDLKFATDKERRYALAYLRSLAGGPDRRQTAPSATHPTYGLTEARGEQIRHEVRMMVIEGAANAKREEE